MPAKSCVIRGEEYQYLKIGTPDEAAWWRADGYAVEMVSWNGMTALYLRAA